MEFRRVLVRYGRDRWAAVSLRAAGPSLSPSGAAGLARQRVPVSRSARLAGAARSDRHDAQEPARPARRGGEYLHHPRQPERHLPRRAGSDRRSEEHTSELQSLMRIPYAVFFLKKKNQQNTNTQLRDTIM